jgi:hypothetical protein
MSRMSTLCVPLIGQNRWTSVAALATLLRKLFSNVVDPYVPPPGALCPCCASAAGRVSLLTPWTAYYTCGACDSHWSRVAERQRSHGPR